MTNEKTALRKSVKNLYNHETGLPIMINLYVIKYIYYHIQKAPCFLERGENGRKAKAIPIYQNLIPISRQRFDRINKGITFELATGEATQICERFGIDIKYFRRDNPVAFYIDGIDGNIDWKCFYNKKYSGGYNLPTVSDKTKDKDIYKKKGDVPESVLKTLVTSDWEKLLSKDDPVYKICYYFHYGKRADEPDNKKMLKEILSEIAYSEWDDVPMESLKELHKLLKKHYSYINSLVTLDNLRNEK